MAHTLTEITTTLDRYYTSGVVTAEAAFAKKGGVVWVDELGRKQILALWGEYLQGNEADLDSGGFACKPRPLVSRTVRHRGASFDDDGLMVIFRRQVSGRTQVIQPTNRLLRAEPSRMASSHLHRSSTVLSAASSTRDRWTWSVLHRL